MHDLAIKLYAAFIGLMNTRYNPRKCGFARAIFADKCMYLASLHIELDFRQRFYTRETL